MGDEDGGDSGLRQDICDDPPGSGPQAGVERGERFVEQHQFRFAGQCPRERHALLLPTGELVGSTGRIGAIERNHLEQFGDLRRAPITAGQSEPDIGANSVVREQRSVLGDVSHRPAVRGRPLPASDDTAGKCDSPGVRSLEPGDQAEQRGLPAA